MTVTILVIWLIVAAASTAIGSAKGRGGTGMALGVFLGLLGLIIIACMSATYEVQVEREAQQIRARADAERLVAGGRPVPAERVNQPTKPSRPSWAARRWQRRQERDIRP
jgi:hypothetical protein